MKNNFKKNKQLLFLFAMLFLVGCSKDTYEESSQNQNETNISHVKFKDLQVSTNKNLSQMVNSVVEYRKSSKTNKLVYNEIYDFYIDEENGIYVNINGKESYTFPIYKLQSDGTVENLVFNEKENGEFSIILADYSLTKEQLDDLNHSFSENDVQYYDMSKFGVSELVCVDIITTVYGQCNHTHSNNYTCGPKIVTQSYCNWESTGGGVGYDGGGDTGGSGGSNTGGSGDTSGGSSGGGSGGGVVTSPNSGLTSAQYQFLSQLNDLTASETFYTFDETTYNNILNYVESNNTNNLLINSIAYFLNNTNTLWLSNQSAQTQQSIFNYLIENNFTTPSKNFIDGVINVLINEPSIDNNALQLMLNAQIFNSNNNYELNEFFFQDNITLFSSEVQNAAALDPVFLANMAIEYMIQRAVLKHNHPNWSELYIAWRISGEYVHLSLDAFGLIPIFGEVGDLANGILYSVEGDGLNATLSFASAIPIVGWISASTKLGIKVIATTTGKTKLVWKLVGSVIQFGSRGQLRKVLGLLPGNPLQAHHIIPWNKQSKSIVQRASNSGNAFHMNEALNGIPLNTAVHSGSHANYDNVIQIKFDQFNASNPNASPDECYSFLIDLIQDVKS